MGCMKCGRDLEGTDVFCESCQAVMARYPVKPGTVVTLPKRRTETNPRRQPRKRVLPPEEQLKRLKKRHRHLRIIAVVLFLLCCVFGWFTAQHLMEETGLLPGQNYSVVETIGDPEE